jgi:hypothetical protein
LLWSPRARTGARSRPGGGEVSTGTAVLAAIGDLVAIIRLGR